MTDTLQMAATGRNFTAAVLIAHLKGKRDFLIGRLAVSRMAATHRTTRGILLDSMIGDIGDHAAGAATILVSDYRAEIVAMIAERLDAVEMLNGLLSEIDGDAIGGDPVPDDVPAPATDGVSGD
jgi:hypothetical protein